VVRLDSGKGIDMGLFVERTPSPALQEIVAGALAASPSTNAGTIQAVTASVQAAANAGPVIVKVLRIAVAILVGAALIAAGVCSSGSATSRRSSRAKLVISNPTYKPPTLGIAAAGTSLITLGGAWSAALVGVILSEK
jgi:hypothetical protein